MRAADGWDNIDPTPATYTWTVGTPTNCDDANITLIAVADGYVDEGSPLENFGISLALLVRSEAGGANARSLLRFELPAGLPDCALERSATCASTPAATPRPHAAGAPPGRGLVARRQVTWYNQPVPGMAPATTTSGSGYREWNVTGAVTGMLAGTVANHGWLIRDAVEEESAGGAQAFRSRESINEPSTPPQLVLRYVADTGTPPPPPVRRQSRPRSSAAR